MPRSLLLTTILSALLAGAGAARADDEAPPAQLTVRYLRLDESASTRSRPEFGLWVFEPGQRGRLMRPDGRGAEGEILFKMPRPEAPLAFLPRSLSNRDTIWDGPDRLWSPEDGDEVWIREGDPKLHSAPVGRRFIGAAYADSERALWIQPKGGAVAADELELVSASGSKVSVTGLDAPDPRQAGVEREGGELVFIYDSAALGGGLSGEIYLVGDFNGWQRAEGKRGFKLSWDEGRKAWTLRLPAADVPLGAGFKFKQRGGGWAPSGGNLILRGRSGLRCELGGRLRWGERYALRMKGEARGADVVPRGWLHSELAGVEFRGELGAICSLTSTTFRVFAPTATAVSVHIYDAPTGGSPELVELSPRPGAQGVWEARREGDLHRRYYLLCVDAPGTHPRREVIDPYSRCNTAHDGRGMILDMRRTDPEGFRAQARPDFRGVCEDGSPNGPEDAIIYEAHIRDFSVHRSSGATSRGRYLGVIERGTTGPGGVKTGLDHLLELGVTHLQLLPFQDFDNDESGDGYNWGYMPVHYNSPEGWYASRKDDETRVVEAKAMVQGLHAAGLRVVLDVVYNHTSSAASFDRVAPFYYYRMRPFSDDPYWNGSGCGNEFRSEAPMGRRFIVDSVGYWAEEYKIDGFRFDLMGLIDRETMVQVAKRLRDIDPSILCYGEPWTAGDTPITKTEKGAQMGQGFGVFNDNLRDAIKGGNHDGAMGWVQRPDEGAAGRIKNGLEGATNTRLGGFTSSPREVINYVACHDNKTLWDKISEDDSASPATRERRHRLATALVILAQGVPFLHAGQEMQRTKKGEHNSYNLPDAINAIDWSWKSRHAETLRYTAGLIALRKAHPVLRLTEAREILDRRVTFPAAPEGVIAVRLDGKGVRGERWDELLIIANGSASSQAVPLPAGAWMVVVDEDEAGVEPVKTGPAELRGEVKAPADSCLVLVKR